MHGLIANTDIGWYERLQDRSDLDEVNFWKPSAARGVRAKPFTPFLFRLKAPHSAICGFGFFAKYSSLPDWMAWDTFGIANGCLSLDEMRQRLMSIREGWPGEQEARPRSDKIGCILIVQPVFFPPGSWVRSPNDWPIRTQSYKGYDLDHGEGQRVWHECLAMAATLGRPSVVSERTDQPRFGAPILIKPRLGQGTFRIAVMDAYSRSCAVTGEHSLPALEAVHIRPYADNGPHTVRNGLLLRADFHRLFDAGYITVDEQLRLVVGSRLKEDFQNGKSYYPSHGLKLQLPSTIDDHPGSDFLTWHREKRFVG